MITRRHGLLLLVLTLSAPAPAMADLADPTTPATHASPAQPGTGQWVLHSTLIGPERRDAVINGRLVRVGDRIAGARVARIEAGEVLLDTPGQRVQLRLLPDTLRIHARE